LINKFVEIEIGGPTRVWTAASAGATRDGGASYYDFLWLYTI